MAHTRSFGHFPNREREPISFRLQSYIPNKDEKNHLGKCSNLLVIHKELTKEREREIERKREERERDIERKHGCFKFILCAVGWHCSIVGFRESQGL